MYIKSSTFVTAVLALFKNARKSQLTQLAIGAGCAAMLVLWRLHAGAPERPHEAGPAVSAGETTGTPKSVGMKWSYDEIAHKLIVQNTDLAYQEIGKGFTQGIGKSLSKVARHIDGKPVIVNL